ncbi:DUF4350 domain-containing protein [Streptomyces sp. KS 21]|uniref:DUF4350 domain-containing protein n=1 Tax=Streptomyces sp. KS 21 TaxID=2485150 RepID=UPI001062A7F2|nr:DUF4350 domain-containing protein [Streptomyces sp. KS 21]TDU77897.1 uncharacterized protein DUF4350 [Streptomyces sp. KS 21]
MTAPGAPDPRTPAPAAAPQPGTATAKPPGAAPGTALGGITPGVVWRRSRGALICLGILLVGAVVLAALGSGSRHGRLDPRSADPDGSRAVAELLQARGVTTRVVTTAREAAAAAGPGTTLLVTDPDRLGDTQRRDIRSAIDLSGGRTVLLAPGVVSLPDLAPAARTKGDALDENLDPGCALPAAVAAGRATTGGGHRYAGGATGTACYPSGGHPTLLVLPSGTPGGDTVLLGSETLLLNKQLASEGNASLALQLLGSRPDLVWYLPSLTEVQDEDPAQEKGLLELVPRGWGWALLQLFTAAALAALWRARRLGPLVTEKLPVAVRASETTEGRARLYRKAGARDRAATVLRTAARERLAALVGVPPGQAHEPAALVPAVSARLTDRQQDLTALLFGTTPTTDAALVALADHLDALEREVRTS